VQFDAPLSAAEGSPRKEHQKEAYYRGVLAKKIVFESNERLCYNKPLSGIPFMFNDL